MAQSSASLNMDGSDDPCYRYQMPPLLVKPEGSSKMKKSVLVNLADVSGKVGRPAEVLLAYLGQSVSAASNIEKCGRAYITGHHDPKVLQRSVFAFIRTAVLCGHCGNPETTCAVEGGKKRQAVYLTCKGCGRRTEPNCSDKFLKCVAQHLGRENVAGPAACPDVQAEAADHKPKRPCPNPACGHKTSKDVCRKCGATLAAQRSDAVPAPLEERRAHIRRWMEERNAATGARDLVHEFGSCTSSFGDQPLDQLAEVIWNLTRFVGTQCDLDGQKLQPVAVADISAPILQRWCPLVNKLVADAQSHEACTDVLISSASDATSSLPGSVRECIVVGMLLCFRDSIEAISDEDLLAGCRRRQVRSAAMEKFMEFLASDDESGDE